MLINSGKGELILKARRLLYKSNKILNENKIITNDLANLYIKTKWLLSITYKMLGDKDSAINICEDLLSNDINKKIANNNIIIHRELFVIEKTKSRLKNIINISNNDPIEYFHLQRRIFEFHIDNHDIKNADSMFKDFLNISNNICKFIDKIYIVATARVIYKYFCLKNDYHAAKHYYNIAIKQSELYNFEGQIKKINPRVLNKIAALY